MEFIFANDFLTVISEIVALIFPNTQFQILFKESDFGNITITFKNPVSFTESFIIRFYPKFKVLMISGYSEEEVVYLIYSSNNHYQWYDGDKSLINKPYSIGEEFEWLAKNIYSLLEEFFVAEVFADEVVEEFPIPYEVEIADAEVIDFLSYAKRLENLYNNQTDLS